MAENAMDVTREQILAFRCAATGLVDRMPRSPDGLRAATRAGCQDSVPRAAVLSLHARLSNVGTDVLDDPDLAQVWGPGFSAYVVTRDDVPVFTLGRLPPSGRRRAVAFDMAQALAPVLADGPMTYRRAGELLGVDPNQLRYAALTGTVELHWQGSGRPTISLLQPSGLDPLDARRELARRFLSVFGPATAADFARWAGISKQVATAVLQDIDRELVEVRSPIGSGWMLAGDEPRLSVDAPPPTGVRLLPSGDTYTLLRGDQRVLLVADPDRRAQLWPSRVWPGALMIDGEVCGTWRRSAATLTVEPWRRMNDADRDAVEAEARALPLDVQPITVVWQ